MGCPHALPTFGLQPEALFWELRASPAWVGETPRGLGFTPDLCSPVLVGSGLQPCEGLSPDRVVRASALVQGKRVASMNPLLTEVSPMTIASNLHSSRPLSSRTLQGPRRREPVHPKFPLTIPSEITDPANAAGAALALCQSRWDEVTLALYLDNQYRLVGHAVVATGWVQAALLTSRPILQGSLACQASTCILVRYRPCGARSASEAEDRTFLDHRCSLQPVRALPGRSPGGVPLRRVQLRAPRWALTCPMSHPSRIIDVCRSPSTDTPVRLQVLDHWLRPPDTTSHPSVLPAHSQVEGNLLGRLARVFENRGVVARVR